MYLIQAQELQTFLEKIKQIKQHSGIPKQYV